MAYQIDSLADFEKYYDTENREVFDLFLKLISNQDDLAKLLNSFSYMEFLGCKGIINALDENLLDINDLLQVLEESKHAIIFKKLAEKISHKKISYKKSDMFCKKTCHAYIFKRIYALKKEMQSHNLYSLHHLADYNSSLLEPRAAWMLKGFQKISDSSKIDLDFNEIIKDENFHVDFLQKRIVQDKQFKEIITKLFAVEIKNFSALIKEFAKEANLTSVA